MYGGVILDGFGKLENRVEFSERFKEDVLKKTNKETF